MPAKDIIVVVNAHPDDICLVGGTVANYVNAGHKVHSLSVTLGETVRPPGPQQEKVKALRKAEGIAIANILGAQFSHLDIPGNKIIPTMELKMKVMDAIRKLRANILLFTTPWDVHADHRNLSWVMRDVIYYVGHDGIKGDYPPIDLKAAYMFDIELPHNELHEPDILIDISEMVRTKMKAVLCKARARVFSKKEGEIFADQMETWSRFWGMRHGVKYAEPLFQCFGSMTMTAAVSKLKVHNHIPY